MKTALITGVTGQDGSYLAELLIEKGYEVHGIKRRSSSINTQRVNHLYDISNFKLHYGDLSDSLNLLSLIEKIKPDEIYNLAAMSHVKVSFDLPEYTANNDAIGTLRILEAIRILKMTKEIKIYQASTSELYGKAQQIPQDENTPFYPRSPYGVSKLYAYWITKNYREAYDMFASNGILFNHESPRRGETFVTRKITRGIAQIINNEIPCLLLGNLNSKRDWGHAKDFVEGMYKILQFTKPDDWVLATGKTATVREFAYKAFLAAKIEIEFEGEGVNEIGRVIRNSSRNKKVKSGDIIIRVDPRYFRPTEVDILIGNPSKANKLLGWKPKYSLDNLIMEMVEADLNEFNNRK